MNGVQRAVRDEVHIEQQGLDLPFLSPRKRFDEITGVGVTAAQELIAESVWT